MTRAVSQSSVAFSIACALAFVACPEHAPLGERGGGGTGGQGGAATCGDACGAAYDCGLHEVMGVPLCKGFKGGDERVAFVAQCVSLCEDTPPFLEAFDSKDCPQAVELLKQFPGFADLCDSGYGAGGAGGAGGATGQGGATSSGSVGGA